MNTRTGITVQNVEPANVTISVRQYPAPGPFGVVELSVDGFTIQFYAQGEDAARTLAAAIRTAAAVDVDYRP